MWKGLLESTIDGLSLSLYSNILQRYLPSELWLRFGPWK